MSKLHPGMIGPSRNSPVNIKVITAALPNIDTSVTTSRTADIDSRLLLLLWRNQLLTCKWTFLGSCNGQHSRRTNSHSLMKQRSLLLVATRCSAISTIVSVAPTFIHGRVLVARGYISLHSLFPSCALSLPPVQPSLFSQGKHECVLPSNKRSDFSFSPSPPSLAHEDDSTLFVAPARPWQS